MPGQLEKSQTSSHFSKQNGQEDTKGNMKGRGGRGEKKEAVREKCGSRGIEGARRKR